MNQAFSLSRPGAPWARCAFGLLILRLSAALQAASPMNGAGSSAAHPVYRIWDEQYAKTGGAPLNYDPAGSSAGLKKIAAHQVDFGASDIAPAKDALAKANLVFFPTVVTGVVPVVNLPKEGGPLVLNGETLARIFAGRITRWDAPEIKALNKGRSLPDKAIQVLVRSDGSGTTYHFSTYLSQVDEGWKRSRGAAPLLPWPPGFKAVKGSQGMADGVKATPGAIGYVDYNYVLEDHLTAVALKNAAGNTVQAGPESFRAALLTSPWMQGGDFAQPLTNQPGSGSWPITMGTFVVLPRVTEHPEKTVPVLRFFTWAFMHGDDLAKKVNFVRLPNAIQAKAFKAIAQVVDKKGTPLGVDGLR